LLALCCGGTCSRITDRRALDRCNLAIREDSQTVLVGEQGRLPLQIPVPVALDSCGWNSPAANATDQNHFGDVLLSFGAQLNTNVIQALNHKSRILPNDPLGKFSFRSRTLALRA